MQMGKQHGIVFLVRGNDNAHSVFELMLKCFFHFTQQILPYYQGIVRRRSRQIELYWTLLYRYTPCGRLCASLASLPNVF